MNNWLDRHVAALAESSPSFQTRTVEWAKTCFSAEIARDGVERNHRFLEEALELVQSLGCTASEAHQLVDYVFGRPIGDPPQELGGVMVTLVLLAATNDMDAFEAGETELARIWTVIDKIRAKQAAKPKHSPLPQLIDDKDLAISGLNKGWNRAMERAGKAEEELLLARELIEAGDNLYASVMSLDDFQKGALETYIKASNAYRKMCDSTPTSGTDHVPHIIINEAAHGHE